MKDKRIKLFILVICAFLISSILACDKKELVDNQELTEDFNFTDKIVRINKYIEATNSLLISEELDMLSKDIEEVQFRFLLNEQDDYINVQFKKRAYSYTWTIGGYTHFEDTDTAPRALDQDFLLTLINSVSTEKLTKIDIEEYFAGESDYKSCACDFQENSQEGSLLVVKTNIKETGNSFEVEIYQDEKENLAGYFSFFGDIVKEIELSKCLESLEEAIEKWELVGDKKYSVEYYTEMEQKQTIRITFNCSDFSGNVEKGYDTYSLLYGNVLKTEEEKYTNIDVDLVVNILEIISQEEITKDEITAFLNDESGQYDADYVVDLIEKEYNKNYNYEITYFAIKLNSETAPLANRI